MEQLPDDVLVAVMQFLDVEDLLACRLVCKRFSSLVLHRDVWRHRSLDDDDWRRSSRVGAVLRLAPCLDKLVVSARSLAVTTTRCAVATLKLLTASLRGRLDVESDTLALAFALALRNQESLGRLRRLQLELPTFRSAPAIDALLGTVALCSGLKSLEVLTNLPKLIYPVQHGPPMPSLTHFRCSVDKNSASFVHTILAGHAATLEEVNLVIDAGLGVVETSRTAELLGTMPRIRSLRCQDFTATTEFCKMLVEALTSCGRSHLERLALLEVEAVRPLLRALPLLPALRQLDLDAKPNDELLKSITTASALTLLEVALHEGGQCPHAWIHRDAVKTTLAANPSLHIQLWCNSDDKCVPQDCETCVVGCHQEVQWDEVRRIGLYSHDPDMCPSPEDHTDDTDWQRSYYQTPDVPCTWIRF
ncbi:uncharacterized protein LOC113205841 isoform X2 [Frankliniella occidentalis]|uniref:Uncharacterized protein LOC113205841 isoform X2 n=1 Tax=Frankliniella occidentalis TaxID=133901 RepID=A0A6J1SDK2_FRAOC|nr:uncharacterized protein LOC113205841 isoform X2 [Frankliniella occidentalis]